MVSELTNGEVFIGSPGFLGTMGDVRKDLVTQKFNQRNMGLTTCRLFAWRLM
jgi:hypothetical protein